MKLEIQNLNPTGEATKPIPEIIENAVKGPSINMNQIRGEVEAFKNIMKRYKNSDLKIELKLEYTILGRRIEMYDVETQYEIENKYSDGSDNEDHNIIKKDPSAIKSSHNRKGSMSNIQSNKRSMDFVESKTKSDDNVIQSNIKSTKIVVTEEYKRQILNSQELSEFMKKNSKYIERVIKL